MSITKRTYSYAQEEAHYDQGLKSYMISVYNHMAIALGITGLVAFIVASSPQLMELFFATPLKWVVMLSPLVMVFFVIPNLLNFSVQKAQMMFFIFSGLMGLSISWIFLAYTDTSIARAFFITASLFGSMSLYGYTTKRDLTSMGSFMIMGLIGIIIASLVNIFLNSPAIHFATSFLSVLIFTGLTAYDTQRIKSIYYQVAGSSDTSAKVAIYGALSLYMDFINLFLQILQFFGDRRN